MFALYAIGFVTDDDAGHGVCCAGGEGDGGSGEPERGEPEWVPVAVGAKNARRRSRFRIVFQVVKATTVATRLYVKSVRV